MADADHGELQCEASPEFIRAELGHALASVTFRNSDRLSQFLRFVVERTLAGNAEQLKEYSIGVEVFGRPSSYDPRLDPVVRLEARRLRAKLLQYYESEGRDDLIRIEVPKGGYSAVFLRKRALPERPAAENSAVETPSSARPASPSSVRWLRWLVPAAAAICLAILGVLFARRAPGHKAASDPVASVAVLPFQNLSANPEDEYFSDGFTDELISALGRVPGLRVAARASTFHFKGTNENLRSIAEQLNVGSIVEGSIQKKGDDIRITAELIRIADGYRIWTETYTRKTADTQAVENDFSRSIASALTKTLAGMPAAEASRHTADPEAHELYLRGRYWWNRRSLADMLKAVRYFNQALEHDPVYAEAYLGLGDTYAVMGVNEQAPPQGSFSQGQSCHPKGSPTG
jgi:adenylate cyclase